MRTTDAPQHDEPDNALVSRLLSRRRLLAFSGAAGAVVMGGAGTAAGRGAVNGSTLDSVKAAASASSACMPLTTQQFGGPYYIDYELFCVNAVEDRAGIPLLLVLRAVDSTTCKPVRNSAVDIWHCDASGDYSGYTQTGNGGGGGTPPSPTPSGPPPTDAPTEGGAEERWRGSW
ncbi:hypothetical protein ACFVH7_04520 [Kitasatospora indigofera]|uniref:hypothetical protein n=1 Tax=Kitasatospora indigofera TaxID=67307 RepID=UPI003635D852